MAKINKNSKKNIRDKETLKKSGYIPPGMHGTPDQEATPRFNKKGSEIVLEGMNNCFIVLGKDREGYFSGEGSTPKGKCGAIDLVAGLASAEGLKLEHGKPKNSNFFKDASRLYLSQKSDVDAYFGLAKGSVKTKVFRKSSAVLKADHTRIIGKEHVKIVAGKAKIRGEEKNSGGGSNEPHGGIDLIAGNYTDNGALQPVVKGDNLEAFLKKIISTMSDMNSRIFKNQVMITKVANFSLSHVHPFVGVPAPTLIVGLTPEVVQSFSEITTNSAIAFTLAKDEKIQYLNPLSNTYINSKLVNTT